LLFYEINPDVVTLARRWFTYWDDAEARGVQLELALGDARLVIEREVAAGDSAPLDLLVIDAFSSDAIPVHLLTAECFDLYRRRLADDGLIAAHVSNQYLYLAPVVRQQAERLGLAALRVHAPADPAQVLFDNDWVVATADPAVLEGVRSGPAVLEDWPAVGRDLRLWTDDFSSLFPLLK
jgi:spermidine synthase